jgi:hypothetical protein
VGVQSADAGAGVGRVEIIVRHDLPGAPAGTRAYGSIVKETYFVEDADVVASYADGRAAITRKKYGEGQAIMIGSYLGLAYHRQHDPSTGAVLAGLIDASADVSRSIVHGWGRVRADVLSAGDEHMIILQNLENERSEVSVEIGGIAPDTVRELFSEEHLQAVRGSDGSLFAVTLEPREVRVYRG